MIDDVAPILIVALSLPVALISGHALLDVIAMRLGEGGDGQDGTKGPDAGDRSSAGNRDAAPMLDPVRAAIMTAWILAAVSGFVLMPQWFGMPEPPLETLSGVFVAVAALSLVALWLAGHGAGSGLPLATRDGRLALLINWIVVPHTVVLVAAVIYFTL